MPVLQIYTNINQLTTAEKEELAKTLTAFYAELMPDFFVNIMFNEVRALFHPLSFIQLVKVTDSLSASPWIFLRWR